MISEQQKKTYFSWKFQYTKNLKHFSLLILCHNVYIYMYIKMDAANIDRFVWNFCFGLIWGISLTGTENKAIGKSKVATGTFDWPPFLKKKHLNISRYKILFFNGDAQFPLNLLKFILSSKCRFTKFILNFV
jgi:hypothetical protein